MSSQFVRNEKAQVSIEMILLTGGMILVALGFYSISQSIRAMTDVTSDWIDQERNASIAKVTR